MYNLNKGFACTLGRFFVVRYEKCLVAMLQLFKAKCGAYSNENAEVVPTINNA